MNPIDLAKALLRKPITRERVEKLKGACKRNRVVYQDVLAALALEDREKVERPDA